MKEMRPTVMERQQKFKIFKGIMMFFIALFICFNVKTKTFAAAPTLTIDGKSINYAAPTSGVGSAGGRWSYTPASGSKVATLTLNNYNGGSIDYKYVSEDLTIVLVGTNKITSTGSRESGIAYNAISKCTLTMEGSGSLAISSVYKGIYYRQMETQIYANPVVCVKANVSITSQYVGINSSGSLIVEKGNLNVFSSNSSGICVDVVIINGGTVTARSTDINDAAIQTGLSGGGSKLETNGGHVTAIGYRCGIDGGQGPIYFNEGSTVIAKSEKTTSTIKCNYTPIHFNGAEVYAINADSSAHAITGSKDSSGTAIYFGDSQHTRPMVFFEGTSENQLRRVKSMTEYDTRQYDNIESEEPVVHIYPTLKAEVVSSQKNATLKLTNKSPSYGSGPAKSITGIRGETISVSVSCAKDKKLGSLYYYKVGQPTKKTPINTKTNTFQMPGYDVVVGANIVDKVKVKKLKFTKTKVTLRKGKTITLNTTIKPKNADDKRLTWKSSNKKIATVTQNGVVKGKKYGTVTITVTAKDGSKKKASCKVSVGYKIDYKLNGGINKKSNPSTYYNKKVTLRDPIRKGYIFKGWYTDRRMKKKISVIKKGKTKNYTLYAKWKKVTPPGRTKIKKLKNITGKKIELRFQTVRRADGYEISYATNVAFSQDMKTVTTSKTISKLKGLKKGTTYYVRVRAYQRDSANKKIHGRYSGVKQIEIKK